MVDYVSIGCLTYFLFIGLIFIPTPVAAAGLCCCPSPSCHHFQNRSGLIGIERKKFENQFFSLVAKELEIVEKIKQVLFCSLFIYCY